MDKAVIVGNCQASALEMVMNTNDTFTRRFSFVTFPAVHEIPDGRVPELHQAVADADVVMLQRVEEGYRDSIGLGTETLAKIAKTDTVVRWPSVYWAGYFPDLFYMRDAGGRPVTDGPFDYHDSLILRAYADGLTPEQACTRLEDPELTSNALDWADDATAELASRGAGCDLDVAGFIGERFRDELLFFTMNHPSNRMLGFIAEELCRLIGIPDGLEIERIQDQILGPTFYPLHPNHVRALGLKFGGQLSVGRARFKIRGVEYDSVDAVRLFYGYYKENAELVSINLDHA